MWVQSNKKIIFQVLKKTHTWRTGEDRIIPFLLAIETQANIKNLSDILSYNTIKCKNMVQRRWFYWYLNTIPLAIVFEGRTGYTTLGNNRTVQLVSIRLA